MNARQSFLVSRCVWAMLCLQEEVHSITHVWGYFVTFLSRSTTWKNCHVWGFVRFAPIAPLRLSDLLSIQFPGSQILHGCRSRCTWHSYSIIMKSVNHKVISKFEWRRFKYQNLQIKTLSYYFCARWSVLMHHRHIKQMARPVLCTLFYVVRRIVWFYVHFPCCRVYSVVLYTLSMLCGV